MRRRRENNRNEEVEVEVGRGIKKTVRRENNKNCGGEE